MYESELMVNMLRGSSAGLAVYRQRALLSGLYLWTPKQPRRVHRKCTTEKHGDEMHAAAATDATSTEGRALADIRV